MATRRKARPKPKRRKAVARRPVARQKKTLKAARKPVRRAAPRRAAPKKTVARRAPQPAAPPAERPAPGQRIGVVTHYFSNLSVAVIKLETGTLRLGDAIHIRGHTSDFGQRVESLQVNHAPVTEAGPNDDVALKVAQHAREHDVVYRVS